MIDIKKVKKYTIVVNGIDTTNKYTIAINFISNCFIETNFPTFLFRGCNAR